MGRQYPEPVYKTAPLFPGERRHCFQSSTIPRLLLEEYSTRSDVHRPSGTCSHRVQRRHVVVLHGVVLDPAAGPPPR